MIIREFLETIRRRLDEGDNTNDLAWYVEKTVYHRYYEFEAEDPHIADLLNNELTDICEQMEPGMVSDKFHRELSEEVDRILALMDQ